MDNYNNTTLGDSIRFDLTKFSHVRMLFPTLRRKDRHKLVKDMQKLKSRRNGVYEVTASGDSSTPWTLTRKSD